MKSSFTSSSRLVLRGVLALGVFLVVGEVLLRLDARFMPFGSRQIALATTVEATPELAAVESGTFAIRPDELRVMVLGDSYIHGGGIAFAENISSRLRELLTAQLARPVRVLDVSRGNSNALDNQDAYRAYVDRFQPHVVILGYNFNDVEGQLNRVAADPSPRAARPRGAVADSPVRRLFKVIYRSEVVKFILTSVHRELKQAGVIIPGSRFDSIRKAYDDSPAWQRVTEILEEMDGDCAARGAEFIVLKFPEMNLLEAGRLFRGYDRAFEAFAAGHPRVHYVDGTRLFEGEASRDFVLHKYDGHPNAAAHGRIAERLARQISRPRG